MLLWIFSSLVHCFLFKMSGVQPFQFKPMYSPDEEPAESEEEGKREAESLSLNARVGNTEWCICGGNCVAVTMAMKSDPRLNWYLESSSCYSGLSHCVPSSSHRLPRSSRHELGLFVLLLTSSSRQLPRSSRCDETRLVATEFVSPTRETESSHITSLRLVWCRVRLIEL